MTKNVLQICPSCAENNGAQWKNPRNTAPLFLGVCGCCKEVKPCTHIQFWQGIKSDSELLSPEELKTKEINAKRREANKSKGNNRANDKKGDDTKASDLLGNGKE